MLIISISYESSTAGIDVLSNSRYYLARHVLGYDLRDRLNIRAFLSLLAAKRIVSHHVEFTTYPMPVDGRHHGLDILVPVIFSLDESAVELDDFLGYVLIFSKQIKGLFNGHRSR